MIKIYDKKSGFLDIPDFFIFNLFQLYIIITTKTINIISCFE